MRLFTLLRCAQAVCCLLVLVFVFSTVDLCGRLIIRTENGNKLVDLMETKGGPCKQLRFFYLPAPKRTQQRAGNDVGFSELGSTDGGKTTGTEDEDAGIGEDAGRIVAVFNGRSVKTDQQLNVTDELSLHAFLVFEWNSQQQQAGTEDTAQATINNEQQPPSVAPLDVDAIDNGTATETEWPSMEVAANGSERSATDGRTESTRGQNGAVKLLPDGPYAFNIFLMDGLTNSASPDYTDPFNEVSYRLIYFTIVALFQLFYAMIHIFLKATTKAKKRQQQKKTKKGTSSAESVSWYSSFECGLCFLLFSLVQWVAVLFLAMGMIVYWEDRWLCTNFRPELPSAFVGISWLAIIVIMMCLGEMLCRIMESADEMDGFMRRGTKQTKSADDEDNDGSEQHEYITVIVTREDPPLSHRSVSNDSVVRCE